MVGHGPRGSGPRTGRLSAMPLRRLLFLTLATVLPAAAVGAPPSRDALAREVSGEESVRSVKALQRLYAQYAQFGLWREIGALFARDATFTFDGLIAQQQTARGGEAIARFLRTRYGRGREGLALGAVHTMMIEA